jgi:hypothetical protein
MLGPAILLYITPYLYIAFHFKNVRKTWKGSIAASVLLRKWPLERPGQAILGGHEQGLTNDHYLT